MRKPFYKKSHKAWYVQHEGQYIRVGRTEKEALKRWAELQDEPLTINAPVVVLLDKFLGWVKRHRAERTFEWYRDNLNPFAKYIGKRLTVRQLKPLHVTEFVAKHHDGNANNTIHGAMRSVQRACNWAVKQGYITRSPVTGLEKPQPTRREVYIEPEQWKQMLAMASDQEETDFLTTMRETGIRPQEIRIIEARHYRDGCITFPVKNSKGKQRNRVVYLNDTVKPIIERLCKEHPTGPIFRNRIGNPWNRNSIRLRFRKFKKKLGIPDLCSTAIRHVFTTEALQNGVNPVALAELLGHTSTAMISRNYSHLFRNPDYLKEQATKATRRDTSDVGQES